eukprot:3866667-Amphidinium_carterae.1
MVCKLSEEDCTYDVQFFNIPVGGLYLTTSNYVVRWVLANRHCENAIASTLHCHLLTELDSTTAAKRWRKRTANEYWFNSLVDQPPTKVRHYVIGTGCQSKPLRNKRSAFREHFREQIPFPRK